LESDKNLANFEARQGSFVIGLIQTNKFACLWQEAHGENDMDTFGLWGRKEWHIVSYSVLLLATNISTSSEMKKQTEVVFLNISGAYDNVFKDVSYGVMLEKELPHLGIVRFMWSLLWCKTLVFCVETAECMTLTGHRGLPQGSVLSPFLYNLLGSGMDRFADDIQYADDIVVYSSHHVLQTASALVQTACSRRSAFFSLFGLTISSTKWEVVLFS
jgi:hypothetical protein